MGDLIKKIIIIPISCIILLAGIFCYQGFLPNNSNCSEHMGQKTVWCDGLLSHRTIISDAVITTLVSVLFASVVFVFVKYIFNLFNKIKIVFYIPKIKDKIPIISPIKIAISKGIIHPRIP